MKKLFFITFLSLLSFSVFAASESDYMQNPKIFNQSLTDNTEGFNYTNNSFLQYRITVSFKNGTNVNHLIKIKVYYLGGACIETNGSYLDFPSEGYSNHEVTVDGWDIGTYNLEPMPLIFGYWPYVIIS